MKKILLLTLILLMAGASTALAIPTLQLDISDSVYDTSTETVVATTNTFTLYALLTPNKNDDALLANTYYLSAAVSPVPASADDLGFFTINGETVNATADMEFGVPPMDDAMLAHDAGDLQRHDIFPTYFTEFEFKFSPDQTVESYNVQDDPGGFSGDGTGSYYVAFDVSTALLGDYIIHFDLYDTVVQYGDVDTGNFAPFSHDAQSAPVPEPATMLLLGSGLLGIAGISRKKLKK